MAGADHGFRHQYPVAPAKEFALEEEAKRTEERWQIALDYKHANDEKFTTRSCRSRRGRVADFGMVVPLVRHEESG